MDQHIETVKHVGDWASIAVVIGTVVGWLTPVAALLSIVWTLIRIWESKTVQGLVARMRAARG
jgi:hypothetical protein